MRKTTRKVLSCAATDLTGVPLESSQLSEGIDETWAALPKRDRGELEIACLIANSPLTGLLTGSRGWFWTSHPPERRLVRFQQMAESSIPLLRTIATSIHQFATAAVYGDPSIHHEFGYHSPLPPSAPEDEQVR